MGEILSIIKMAFILTNGGISYPFTLVLQVERVKFPCFTLGFTPLTFWKDSTPKTVIAVLYCKSLLQKCSDLTLHIFRQSCPLYQLLLHLPPPWYCLECKYDISVCNLVPSLPPAQCNGVPVTRPNLPPSFQQGLRCPRALHKTILHVQHQGMMPLNWISFSFALLLVQNHRSCFWWLVMFRIESNDNEMTGHCWTTGDVGE